MKETHREILSPGTTRVVTLRNFASSSPRLPNITTEVNLSIILREGVDEWDESQTQMGILLQYHDPLDGTLREEFSGHDWGLNLLVWIRARWFLMEIPVIDYSLFYVDLSFLAEQSNYIGDDFDYIGDKSDLNDFLALIGEQRYQELKKKPFDLAEIRQCLQLAARFSSEMVLQEISSEVRAGTVRWSPELRAAGVKHPDYWVARYQAKEKIVGRYQRYMIPYAEYSQITLSHLVSMGEWKIAACVERGIEQDYGPAVAFLLGLLLAQIQSDEYHLQYLDKRRSRFPPEEWSKWWTPPSKEARFEQAITWLLGENLQAGQQVLSFEGYQKLLLELYDNYDHLQVRFPLVPEPV